MAEHAKPKRAIKGVTTATATGGTIGAAIAQLLVHVFPYLEGTEAALTVILTAVLALLGGYLVPPKEPEVIKVTDPETVEYDLPGEDGVEVYDEPGVEPVDTVRTYDMR